MNIIKFYTSVLRSIGLNTTEEGYVKTDFDDGEPITVDGKRLTLPIPEHLKNPNFNDLVYFHPLSENMLVGGESKVFKRLRKLVNDDLHIKTVMLAKELLALAANNKVHKTLTPEQHVLIQTLSTANSKANREFDKVIKSGKRMVDVFIKPGGVFRGNKCSRVAVAKFFFAGYMDDDSTEFMGVDIATKRDKKTIADLFRFIFPRFDEPDVYNFGSNDPTAPYFHALLSGYIRIGGRLNELIRLFDGHLSAEFKAGLGDNYQPTFDWEPALSCFSNMMVEIPPLPENIGNEDNLNAADVASKSAASVTETKPSGSAVRKKYSINDVVGGQGSRPIPTPVNETPPWEDRRPQSGWGTNSQTTSSGWGTQSSTTSGWGTTGSTASSGFGSQKRRASINDIRVDPRAAERW